MTNRASFKLIGLELIRYFPIFYVIGIDFFVFGFQDLYKLVLIWAWEFPRSWSKTSSFIIL